MNSPHKAGYRVISKMKNKKSVSKIKKTSRLNQKSNEVQHIKKNISKSKSKVDKNSKLKRYKMSKLNSFAHIRDNRELSSIAKIDTIQKKSKQNFKKIAKFKNYTEMLLSIRKFESLSWEKLDPKLIKASPMKNPPFNSVVFWFIICSNYFRRIIFKFDSQQFIKIVQNKLNQGSLFKKNKVLNKSYKDDSFFQTNDNKKIVEKTSTKFDPIIREDFENYKVQFNVKLQTDINETLNKEEDHTKWNKEFVSQELLSSYEIEQKAQDILPHFKKNTNLLNSEIIFLKCRNTVFRYLDDKGAICKNPVRGAIKNSPSKFIKTNSASKIPNGQENQTLQKNLTKNLKNIPLESSKVEPQSTLLEETITKDNFWPSVKDMSIDNLIDIHSMECSKVSADINQMLQNITQKFDESKLDESRFIENYDEDSSTCDIVSILPQEMKFLVYLEKNRYRSKIQGVNGRKSLFEKTNSYFEYRQKPREAKYDDYVCQICSEGDTSEGNVIVFCSRCSITIHQKCYGLESLPQNDWICDLCLAYGKDGKYLSCLACSRKGGALRKTEVSGNLQIWKDLNPTIHEQYKSQTINNKRSPKKYQPINNRKKHAENRLTAIKSKIEKEKNAFEKDLYYNFFTEPDEYSEEELKILKLQDDKLWIHLTCGFWLPEISFNSIRTKICDLENIDALRFSTKCEVCKKASLGACVQCPIEGCTKSFHPECARRAGLNLEYKKDEHQFWGM